MWSRGIKTAGRRLPPAQTTVEHPPGKLSVSSSSFWSALFIVILVCCVLLFISPAFGYAYLFGKFLFFVFS